MDLKNVTSYIEFIFSITIYSKTLVGFIYKRLLLWDEYRC